MLPDIVTHAKPKSLCLFRSEVKISLENLLDIAQFITIEYKVPDRKYNCSVWVYITIITQSVDGIASKKNAK